MSYVTHMNMNESCHTYAHEWVISHEWTYMSHVTHINLSTNPKKKNLCLCDGHLSLQTIGLKILLRLRKKSQRKENFQKHQK